MTLHRPFTTTQKGCQGLMFLDKGKGQLADDEPQGEFMLQDITVAGGIEPDQNMAMETELVNIPLTFSTRGTGWRGKGRRRWGSGIQAKLGARNREREITIIKSEPVTGHLTITGSDHSIIWVDLFPGVTLTDKRRKRRFRFETMWARTTETVFRNTRQRLKEVDEQICALATCALTTNTTSRLVELHREMDELSSREELMWKQCLKALRLHEDDRNMTFFHAKATERKIRKEIHTLCDETGNNPKPDVIREVVDTMEVRVTEATNEALFQPRLLWYLKKLGLYMKILPSPEGAGAEVEDAIHVLALCLFARLVWAISSIPWAIVAPATEDVESWFRRIRSMGARQDFELAAMTSWAIWYNKNMKVFEGAGTQGCGVGLTPDRPRRGRVVYDPG
ncbi:hypothetical protein Salat_2768800 [Sesamum alatum]|uniref:Uncharacterized protein n=1 Tax=Sesamum alatum TaxID=300844 RepID=A0AAE1XLE2_9LAMI|nr:hypothetical protein Salat_2768800 [Sesamum alatum]